MQHHTVMLTLGLDSATSPNEYCEEKHDAIDQPQICARGFKPINSFRSDDSAILKVHCIPLRLGINVVSLVTYGISPDSPYDAESCPQRRPLAYLSPSSFKLFPQHRSKFLDSQEKKQVTYLKGQLSCVLGHLFDEKLASMCYPPLVSMPIYTSVKGWEAKGFYFHRSINKLRILSNCVIISH